MEKEKIYEMIIREMTEKALRERREEPSAEDKELEERVLVLSQQLQERLETMEEADRQLIEENINAKMLLMDRECQFLYVQGARDCVALLKELGVL